MRKIRDVLRLYFAAALSIRAIARSLGTSPSTVGRLAPALPVLPAEVRLCHPAAVAPLRDGALAASSSLRH